MSRAADFLEQAARGAWTTLTQMAPFLLFGFLLAGCISVFLNADWVRRHLGTGRFLPILKAALFGVPLPLCSCGVIPVAASLRRQGASRGATVAFLVSTPQTGVDSMLVAFSLLGLAFAAFTPFAALLSGLLVGVLVDRLGGREPDAPVVVSPESAGAAARPWWVRIPRHAFLVLARDIAWPLLLGIVAAGVIGVLFPPSTLSQAVGSGFGAKLIMLLAGIPVYVCASASAPVVAALIAAGVSPGAGLVFLMTGPATNAATLTTIWKTMGGRVAAIYLGGIAACALAAGVLMDLLFDAKGWSHATVRAACHAEPGSPWPALLLLGILLFAKTRRR